MIKRRVLTGSEEQAAKAMFKPRDGWLATGRCPLCNSFTLDKSTIPLLPAVSPFQNYIGIERCSTCWKFFKKTTRILTDKGWGHPDASFKKVKTIQPGEDDMRML